MVKQTKWTERQFDFNFPIGVFPCILERLRGTPARLEDLTSALPVNILTIRVQGSWSIQENVGHLLDLEELGERRLLDYRYRAAVLTSADMENRKTYKADHNSNSMKDLLRQFRNTRHAFVDKLEQLDEEEVARSSLHPRLNKQMRVFDWAYFMAEHDDHHVTRVHELSLMLQKRI